MSTEPTIRFYGTIENGQRKYYKAILHSGAIASLEGQEFEETLQPRFKETTVDQHGYYRGGIIKSCCMESETFGGWSADEISAHFSEMFLTYKINKEISTINGVKTIEIICRESTANLGKKKMSEFIDNVLNYLAQEHDLHPLSPNEYFNAKYATQIKK